MVQNLKEIIMHIQYSEAFGLGLSLVSAVLLAMLTELLVQHIFKNKKYTFLKLAGVCVFIFLLYACTILLLLRGLLHFFPKGESLSALLKNVMRENAMEFIIPMVIALFVGGILGGVGKKKRWANTLLCLLVAFSTLVSSIMFFWNSFRMIQRPQYVAPIESISSIINSRLRIYPFILSGDMLKNIGDGEELVQEDEESMGEYGSDAVTQEEEYLEPSDFSGYINAIVNGTYAPGMGVIDYLDKAYTLYLNGEHQNAFFNIGLMWDYINDYYSDFQDRVRISKEKCLEESIAAYKRFEKLDGGSDALYNNMAIVYYEMGNISLVREYLKKALELGEEESHALSNYLYYIYSWVDDAEDLKDLMEDAETILSYEKNLSMYILYGACAISENRNVELAYGKLREADDYYKEKSTMVKILQCICADLISENDMTMLHEIYDSEKNKELTYEEEMYLIRYLFATNRYEELWGYIMDVGSEEDSAINAELVAIKSDWYFKNPDRAQADIEDIRLLLQKIEDKLDGSLPTEDRNLYLLAQTLLKDCIGEEGAFDLETGVPEEVSGIQYVFLATDTFNEGDYDAAIGYCEAFFDAEKNGEEGDDGLFSLKQLEPQERTTLRNYIQLIIAHSHFEYAKNECRKGSEEWKAHMEAAEKECDAFQRYSKSMIYIEEQFRTLKNSIDIENGIIPENQDETGRSKVEVD